MLAAVLKSPGKISVEDVPEPEVPPGWVKVRVEEVGICGTDKAFYKGSYVPGKLPIIPGHEIAGIVVEVGDGVPKDIVGARVTTEINIWCGKCWFCLNGLKTHCPYREVLGITVDGGMAEYVAVPYSNIHVVSELDPAAAAFVEPLAAVLEAIELEPPSPGSSIAVVGIGTIGLLFLQVLRYYSPKALVAVARPNSPKAELAKRLGADEVLTYEEALDFIKENTHEGQGFDYVVEVTGSPEGLDIAVSIARPRAVVAAKSTHGELVGFNYTLAVVKELRIVCSRCGPFKPAIRMLRDGLVSVRELVTSTYNLREAEEAFRRSLERDQVKVHLRP
ncbi:MAG: alcohol dehydrogenase catalytic domain-containing protein [Desulfurococcales archaeon]|nr:alcohol dehydrogenase catalytic domain-containing protein [Desulfurococcales archaeon]